MEYEKLFLQLLERVTILEEKVKIVEENKTNNIVTTKPQRGTYTSQVKDYINNKIMEAKQEGANFIILTSYDIAKNINLRNRFPLICNAMKSNEFKYEILSETPSGYSSTLKIKYFIN